MRVFEALAAGPLLATNDLADNGQAELFRDGEHLATYRDAEEMLDKVAFYLARPAARSKVEDAGMREVVEKHTYRHRMEQILAAAERLPTTVPMAAPNPIPTAYDPSYFEFDRPELLERVPRSARSVLEVGCGAGRLGATLKARQGCRITGLEFDAAAAAAARARLDEVHEGDCETMALPFGEGTFDAAICGDVLEHLRDPLALLRKLRGWLRPDGRVVASIPNVRHHTVVSALLAGHWTYEPAGLLDRTHLRFFTRREIEKLLFRAGFDIESVAIVPGPGHAEWAARGRPGEVRIGRLHIGGVPPEEAEEFYAYQYLVVARPAERPDNGLTSIVILTLNQLEYTRRCVDSIRLVTDEPYELIFIDNASTDGTPGYLHALAAGDPRVKVICNTENRGFPAGCNQGIAAASGRQVLLLNNDTVVTTGWLTRLLQALHADPKVGLVGPCTDNISGEQQVPAGFEAIEELDGFAWDWAKAHDRRVEDTDRLVGFCLLIRREVIDKIGTLDERFGVGCFEDDDYCRRALRAGYRAVIARDAFIHHAGGATFRASRIDFAALMGENQRKYEDKWKENGHVQHMPALQPKFALRAAPGGGLLLERALRSDAASVASVNGELHWDAVERGLGLCMIVRDNAKTIVPCLTSIRPHVDHMTVIDTGSLDETPRLCRELGAEVHYFTWCDDFSAARNESLRFGKGRWLFWMDSDDTISEENGRALRALALGRHDPRMMGYVVQVHCPGPDGTEDVTVVDHVKLFINRPDLRFEGRIHEQIIPAIRRAGGDVAWTDLFVTHSGYDRSPEGQERKKQRDFKLLRLELAERPDHPFTLFNLGMTHADVGEHAEAVGWLERCLAVSKPEESHLRKAYSLLIHSLTRADRADDAMRRCEEGLRLYPVDAELRFRKGVLLYESGRFSEAVAAYQDLLARDEERHFTSAPAGLRGFMTHQNLALAYEGLGRLTDAEAQWRAVVSDAPAYRPGWRGLGEVLLTAGRLDAAREAAHRLAGNGRLAPEGATLAAHVALRRGDAAAARRAMEDAVAHYPRDAQLRRDWSRLLFEYFSPLEAEPHLQALLELEPDDAATWHNFGTLRLQQRRLTEAANAFGESLRLRPDSALTRDLLAQALGGGS
jgi:GT2 family glycosyltransferase/tetratricopeptide (TPR) repeat protein/2-polyprenyl-3-methyl-5-hydroxy-6-metoxy-1,4-benzoquinol methylase